MLSVGFVVCKCEIFISANYEYSKNGGLTYQAGTSFVGLAPGNYPLTVRNTLNGCISSITNLTVNTIPVTPAATASVTTQPTCVNLTGVIQITAPIGANYQYSIDGGANYQFVTSFTGLIAGNYSITVKDNATGCISTPTGLTVNPIPNPPTAPTASVTVQPTCILPTGTIVVTAPLGANFAYSINGGLNFQAGSSFSNLLPGNYTIIVKDLISACVSTGTTVTVNIVAPPSPAPIITSPVNYCQNDRAIALNALGINLLWYTSATGGTGTSTAPTPNTAAIGSNSFYVSQTLIGFCESARVPVLVNVFANPTAYAGGPIIDVFPGQTITLNGAATGNNISILWSPASLVSNPIIVNPSINLQYDQLFTIRVNSADGCSATDQVKVNVLLALIIPNVFSPNGDNINDTWTITNIEKYPTARIEIFNRYGQSIFVSTGYQNNWKGTYAGKDLPVGTYYWIINNPRLNNKMSGAVSIIR